MVVVGSVNVDVVVRVEQLPAPGETVLGSTLERGLGGKGANAAVAAARQGAEVRLVGCVGDDDAGAWALKTLADEGVDVSAVRVAAGLATGHALISVRPDGIGQITVAPLANALLGTSDVVGGGISPGDVVVAQLEVPLEVVRAALSGARSVGARTILDPAPAIPLDGALLELVDVLMPNEHELAALGGDVEALLRGGTAAVIVTKGEQGCEWFDGEGTERLAAHRVDAVDATGAGDAFCGAFAAALSSGVARRTALQRAIVAGALATTRHGALASMPTASEVDDALRTSG